MRAPDTSARDLPLKSKSPRRCRLPPAPSTGRLGKTASTGRWRSRARTSISMKLVSSVGLICSASTAIASKSSSTSPCRKGTACAPPLPMSRLLMGLTLAFGSLRVCRYRRVIARIEFMSSTFDDDRRCRSTTSWYSRSCRVLRSRLNSSSACAASKRDG